MKKRIIGMLLLVCMIVTALASCAYSYENDDMTKYVTFDKDAFLAGLQALEITDADFGTDEEKRQEKVDDAIYTALAGKADTDVHKTEGNPGKYDLLYYCYYATFVEGEGDAKKDVTVYASSMKESSATKLQLGLTSNKDLNKGIADEIAKLIAEDGAGVKYYKTKTTETAAGNATVVVTYSKTVTTAEGAEKKTTYTNEIVTLPAGCTGAPAEGSDVNTPANFLEYLIGKEVNKDLSSTSFGTGTDKVTYSGIRINWIIEGGMDGEFTVKHTPFPSDIKEEKKEVKALDGSTVDLKGKELTYHIFPVYFVETPALDAEIILDKLLGTNFKAGADADENGTIEDSEKGTLDVFTDDGFKNGDETLNAMVTKLIELLSDRATKQTALDNAQKTYDDAKSAHDKATTPTQDQINALNTAETALNKAKEDLEGTKQEDGSFKGGAKNAVADQIAKILAAKKGEETAADAIMKSYREYRYDTLENTYESAIKASLAQAIYDLAISTIKYGDNLPEQAVNEAYDLLINNYEYDFYEGTYTDPNSSSSSSASKKTNYEQYGGNFISYLIAELGMKTTDTKEQVYAAIREDAKKAVKEKILIYVLKSAVDDQSKVQVTNEDVDTFKAGINYLLLQYYMGSNNVKESYYMPALQFDKVMNYFLEVDETNEENTIKYVRIAYSFKAEDADEEAAD